MTADLLSTEMECGCTDSCDWVTGDYDAWVMDVIATTAPTLLECGECGVSIKQDDRYYLAYSYRTDESFYARDIFAGHFIFCRVCGMIRRDYGECASFGGLAAHIAECLGVDILSGEPWLWSRDWPTF